MPRKQKQQLAVDPRSHFDPSQHHKLHVDSKCQCLPCQTRPSIATPELQLDDDIEILKSRRVKSKVSDFITLLSEIHRYSGNALFNMQILDTVIFNPEGSVRCVFSFENERLRIGKLTSSLKNFMKERKHDYDLQYQKKKFQRERMGFSFTQLDHESEKYIKQFEEKIIFMNPLLNRVAILKMKNKQEQEVLTQSQINSMFSKIARKIFDLTSVEYMQIFPVMYEHEQSSYLVKIKYFREREVHKKNYKVAEHYISNWFTKNQSLDQLEQQFLNTLRFDEEERLMYFTYKLFIYFQRISNKMVDCALLHYITNDQGHSFYLKNVECLNMTNLTQISDRGQKLPQKLEFYDPKYHIDLRTEMKGCFDTFQKNYDRLQREGFVMEEKRLRDCNYSNSVFESLGYNMPENYKNESFVKWIGDQNTKEKQPKTEIISSPISTEANQK